MRCAVAVCGIALAIAPSVVSAEEIAIRPPIMAEGADWVGYAAAPSARVFRATNAVGEVAARTQARAECERATGRTCNAIAVPVDWPVVVLNCANKVSFVGGSPLGNAVDVARLKAQRAGFYADECIQVYPQ